MSGHWKQQFVFSSQPHSITVTNAFVPIPANHFPAFTTTHSLILFNMEIMHILDHDLFLVFLGLLLSLAPAAYKITHFSLNRHRPFIKHVHTIAVYFFIPYYMLSF